MIASRRGQRPLEPRRVRRVRRHGDGAGVEAAEQGRHVLDARRVHEQDAFAPRVGEPGGDRPRPRVELRVGHALLALEHEGGRVGLVARASSEDVGEPRAHGRARSSHCGTTKRRAEARARGLRQARPRARRRGASPRPGRADVLVARRATVRGSAGEGESVAGRGAVGRGCGRDRRGVRAAVREPRYADVDRDRQPRGRRLVHRLRPDRLAAPARLADRAVDDRDRVPLPRPAAARGDRHLGRVHDRRGVGGRVAGSVRRARARLPDRAAHRAGGLDPRRGVRVRHDGDAGRVAAVPAGGRLRQRPDDLVRRRRRRRDRHDAAHDQLDGRGGRRGDRAGALVACRACAAAAAAAGARRRDRGRRAGGDGVLPPARRASGCARRSRSPPSSCS